MRRHNVHGRGPTPEGVVVLEILGLIGLVAMLGNCRPRSPTPTPRMKTPTTMPTTAEAQAMQRAAERTAMVRSQIAGRGIKDQRVLAAMRTVPRHRFVPHEYQSQAYEDRPLPIGEGQTISQPYIVALMTEAADVQPGDKVLEIGTGSGYQAAVLAELTDQVFTIEIVEPLARRAMERLTSCGYEDVHVRIGDGYRGWPEEAPFDAIIVTAAPETMPQPLVDQLAVGGRLVIPVGGQWLGQDLLLLEKQPDGTMKKTTVAPVRFVPMTGEAEK